MGSEAMIYKVTDAVAAAKSRVRGPSVSERRAAEQQKALADAAPKRNKAKERGYYTLC